MIEAGEAMNARAKRPTEARAYLALGSNLGDRRKNLRAALRQLSAGAGLSVVRVSRAYRSAPVGVQEQPEFLNLVAEARTTMSPRQLLRAAKRVERAMGRVPGPRWGPRIIDVDILMYESVRMKTAELTLPHPRMVERAFVMVPLAEIAPDLTLPDGRRAAEVAARLSEEQPISADVHLRG